MSGFISHKYTEQQEFQEGQVPDDIQDQPTTIQPQSAEKHKKQHKSYPEEDQFIFQTVPDHQLEDQYPHKHKDNRKPQEYYQSNQSNQKRDRQRKQKDTGQEKSQKQEKKKQSQNLETKKKNDAQQIRINPNIPPPGTIPYYPGIPPMNNPYISGPTPSFYPPVYQPMNQNVIGSRPPYGMYPGPPLHHQTPPQMYIPTNPYQIPASHLYQVPPSQLAYNQMPIVQPIQMYQPNRNVPDNSHAFNYDQTRTVNNKPYQQSEGSNFKNTQNLRNYQTRQKQDNFQHQRETQYKVKQEQPRQQQRQRSRDKRDHYQFLKNDKKQKNFERNQNQYSKQKFKDSNAIPFQNERKLPKKSEFQEKRLKSKLTVSQNLNSLFDKNSEEKEQFLMILRDILKYRLLKKQQQEAQRFEGKSQIYSGNKDLIISNYQKALLKLQNIILSHSQSQKLTNSPSESMIKKEALFQILICLQLQQIIVKIKQMRLKKRLFGEKKMSEIKKLLDDIVKDPRKKIK